MNAADLPRSTPTAEGVSAAGIEAFLDACAAVPEIALHSLMIVRHGRVVAEGWWAPYRREDPHLVYSVSKSVTATALGLALHEGRLSLEDTVVQHFPDLDPGPSFPRARAISVDHLARMATGHHGDTFEAIHRTDPAEPVRAFLRIEPESEPGSVFAYNNGGTYALSAVLQQCTGQSLTAYLQPRLFDPLGIAPPPWDTLGGPRELGFSGVHLRTEDLARFGQLYLQQGVWSGSPVLPAGWVAEATRAHTANPDEPEPDWQQGYGYQFWRARHGYRADGAYGQFVLVLPEQDAVVAITGETELMQAVLDAVWAHLRPAFDGPTSAADDARLVTRLASAALPTSAAGAYPADDWVTATAVAEQPDGWALTVADPDQSLVIDCGDAQWRRTAVPVGKRFGLVVEAQGRWAGTETFVAELIFVQTPHRMTVTFTPRSGRSTAYWRTVPLRSPSLAGLATPLGAGQAAGSPR